MHTNSHETVLPKAELRELYEARQDLVARVSSFGAEIPTTSMHWKRVGHDLEWIVRQMSWAPPWTPCDPRGFLDEHPSILDDRRRNTGDAGEHAPAHASKIPAVTLQMQIVVPTPTQNLRTARWRRRQRRKRMI